MQKIHQAGLSWSLGVGQHQKNHESLIIIEYL